MALYSAQEIAETIINLSREQGLEITNLKLQKLVYYAQAWYLALKKTPLFWEPIEAWIHGPVVPSVFRRFKSYRWNSIDCPVKALNDGEVVQHLNSVLDAYGKLHATQLERLTHSEEPWREARAGIPLDEPSSAHISRDTMQRFYSSKIQSHA